MYSTRGYQIRFYNSQNTEAISAFAINVPNESSPLMGGRSGIVGGRDFQLNEDILQHVGAVIKMPGARRQRHGEYRHGDKGATPPHAYTDAPVPERLYRNVSMLCIRMFMGVIAGPGVSLPLFPAGAAVEWYLSVLPAA